MAFIPVPDCWRVAFDFTSVNGETGANVFHVRDIPGDMTLGRATDLVERIRDWAALEWDVDASADWTLQTITATDASQQFGVQAVDVVPTPGVVASDMLPAQNTIAVTFHTGVIGRSNRGRLYHVGLSEGDIVDGRLSSASRTSITNAYLALMTDLTNDDFELVVASKQLNGAVRNPAVTRAVTDMSIHDTKIDSQKRRKG